MAIDTGQDGQMRDPDGYLIEVGEYSQTSLDHFNEYASQTEKKTKKK